MFSMRSRKALSRSILLRNRAAPELKVELSRLNVLAASAIVISGCSWTISPIIDRASDANLPLPGAKSSSRPILYALHTPSMIASSVTRAAFTPSSASCTRSMNPSSPMSRPSDRAGLNSDCSVVLPNPPRTNRWNRSRASPSRSANWPRTNPSVSQGNVSSPL